LDNPRNCSIGQHCHLVTLPKKGSGRRGIVPRRSLK
jgi:hypothetical protein